MADQPSATICRICKENCGILVTRSKNGIRIKGNPQHPISKGFICFRGRRFSDIRHSPERLKEPLLRRGDRWTPITFDDAVCILARELERCKNNYDAQSIALLKGESLKHQEIRDYMEHLAHALGTPNYLSVGSICHQSLAMAHGMTYGGIPRPDYTSMKTALLWGSNPAVSSVRMFKGLKKVVKKGVKLVVVDPCETSTSQIADLHLKVKPGSDGFLALALALLKRAIETYGLSPDPQKETGWGMLKEMIAGQTHAGLLEKTGIGHDVFMRASELIFGNLPAWNLAGSALELQPGGVQTIRAVACLQAILDPQNRPTAMGYPLNPLPGREAYPPRVEPIGHTEAPLFTRRRGEGQAMFLPKAILHHDPYPIRAMMIIGANPLLTFPDPALQMAAYRQLDFLAVCDLFMTPTARMADLVLPAADFLDNLELHDYGQQAGRPYLGLVEPIMASGPGRPVWKWIFDLARQMGLQSFFPWNDNAAAIRYKLSGRTIGLADLKQSPASVVSYEADRPPYQDGKTVETVKFYASAAQTINSGLPTPESLQLPYATNVDYPFWLSTGDKLSSFQHSQFRMSSRHLARHPQPGAEIHPRTAQSMNIADGDRIVVATRSGEISIQAAHSPQIRMDCIRISHGWEEANANVLTDWTHCDPLSGFPWCRAIPARIRKKEK